jgi:hypothetical protein
MSEARSVQTESDYAHESRQSESDDTGEHPDPWLPHHVTLRIGP